MVSDPLTVGWYVDTQNAIDPMLIVCPSCSTSYAIEPGSLGSAGRTVRCARCRTTSDGSEPAPEMTVAADDAAEADGTFTCVLRPDHPVNSSSVEAEQPADAEQTVSSATQDNPAAAPSEIPAAIADAPSVVPAIEPLTHSPGDTDSDEIENFAARRKRLQARRKQARHSSAGPRLFSCCLLSMLR